MPVAEVFGANGCHPEMNPRGVVFALDVSGSMGEIPQALATETMPLCMESVRTVLPDPQVMFMAFGNAWADRSPLQVGQFESEAALIDRWLAATHLEGGGGGLTPSVAPAFGFGVGVELSPLWSLRGHVDFAPTLASDDPRFAFGFTRATALGCVDPARGASLRLSLCAGASGAETPCACGASGSPSGFRAASTPSGCAGGCGRSDGIWEGRDVDGAPAMERAATSGTGSAEVPDAAGLDVEIGHQVTTTEGDEETQPRGDGGRRPARSGYVYSGAAVGCVAPSRRYAPPINAECRARDDGRVHPVAPAVVRRAAAGDGTRGAA